MPTYEYACTDCGQHLEVVQRMSEAPLTTCAVCGGRLRKVFAPIGIVFKGSGFYRTDSRGKPPADGKADKADKAKKSDAGTSESKGASKDGASKATSAKDKPASKSA